MPTPREDESQRDFIARCVPNDDVQQVAARGTKTKSERSKKAVAICGTQFRRAQRGNAAEDAEILVANAAAPPPADAVIHAEPMRALQADPGLVERRSLNGREHAVFPAVMLVEGAVKGVGQDAAELALASEFGANPDAWEGVPVRLDHAYAADGRMVSANSAELQDEVLGFVANARLEGDGLRGDVWVDLGAVRAMNGAAQATLDAIEAGQPIQVSTSYFVKSIEPRAGQHKGRAYTGIQRGIFPDHLALLPPGMAGACSWDDGCGVRAHAEDDEEASGLFQAIKGWFAAKRANAPRGGRSDTDKRALIQAAMQAKGIRGYVFAVWPNAFVYHDWESGGSEAALRRSYGIGGDGSVTLGDEVEKGVLQMSFQPVKANADHQETEDMTERDKAVGALIAAKHFDEGQSDWLKGLSDDQFGKIAGLAGCSCQETRANAEQQPVDLPPQPPKLRTLDEVFAMIENPDMRSFVQDGVSAARARKESLIARIKANSANPYSDDELNTKPLGEIKKIAAFIPPSVDYTATGGPRAFSLPDQDDWQPKPPPVLFPRKEN